MAISGFSRLTVDPGGGGSREGPPLVDDAGSQTPPAPAGHPHGERCGPVTKGQPRGPRSERGVTPAPALGPSWASSARRAQSLRLWNGVTVELTPRGRAPTAPHRVRHRGEHRSCSSFLGPAPRLRTVPLTRRELPGAELCAREFTPPGEESAPRTGRPRVSVCVPVRTRLSAPRGTDRPGVSPRRWAGALAARGPRFVGPHVPSGPGPAPTVCVSHGPAGLPSPAARSSNPPARTVAPGLWCHHEPRGDTSPFSAW